MKVLTIELEWNFEAFRFEKKNEGPNEVGDGEEW